MVEVEFPYPHDADPDIFREALSYSEALTGFTASLIEKDYYCSLILHLEFKRELDRQLEGQLRPVLRPADFDSFNMDEAFDVIVRIAGDLSG